MILCSIPADFKVPDYITVDALTVAGDGVSGTIKADNQTTYTVQSDTQILPYLTRNIVTLQDLVKGRKCLVWTQSGSNTAYKIVAFAGSAGTDGTGDVLLPRGWSSRDGKMCIRDSHNDHVIILHIQKAAVLISRHLYRDLFHGETDL